MGVEKRTFIAAVSMTVLKTAKICLKKQCLQGRKKNKKNYRFVSGFQMK